ncbi:hypothetical protein OAB30_01375 [Polaribacter sp.]|jgi:sterol desaturase/sphingolipid hydroxylase (fatty acid hydroxylase superfamily)|nr:hypothetical protein [Polaribacter sp.]MDB4167083.1 hypothetical protein [Polaribacter sp.]MDB4201593.1 hypothetical protein [Polaribacter sp.]MDB9777449.1 hypothetical protein [Polaribacter sp.]MDB9887694.1 hypothetical protein [Polaribacter sp.]
MDLLDNYKKAWENQPEEITRISASEIYKMTQAKSSSIVKWIFVIGLLEFAFMILSPFVFDISNDEKILVEMEIYEFVQISQYLAIPVLFYFLFLFYKNYKNISSIDNTKKLMTKIKKTRRTVRNYVIFNLLYIVYLAAIITFGMVMTPQGNFENTPGWIIVLIMILVTIIMLFLFWGFYQLLYGILLNKLNRNYIELAKLDQEN